MKNYSFYKGRSAFWYLIIIGFTLSNTPALANKLLRQMQSPHQQNQISGTITDGKNPLPGVTISIKGKRNSTVSSDFNGQYILSATATDTLLVSFIGFKTAIVPIRGRKIVNVQLQEDITSLQEVRVNAGYYTVKESERTGSIAKISSKDIEKQPVTNILAAMQGRMAGVSITQETGVPGGGFNINIRGVNSLRTDGNAPLYIIDGVPYSSDPISYRQTSTTIPGESNPLNSINPSDIENLEILKDADATAIYGSRGANGVVLITTKKGKAGVTSFTINTSHATGTVTRMLDMMNTQQYLKMRRQAFANDGITTYPSNAYDVNGTWDQNRYTDWQKELTGGTADILSMQGTVSGGSEQTRFLLSGNYRTESTVFPGDFLYKKGGAHLSLDHKSENNKFRISFSGGYTAQKNDLPWTDLTLLSRNLAPNAPALYDGQGNLNWEDSTWQNPLSNLEGKNRSETYDLVASTLMTFQLAKGIEFKSSFGFTDLSSDASRTAPSTMYNPAYNYGSEYSSIFKNTLGRQSWIVEPQLNWHSAFGRSEIDVLLGSTFQNQQTKTRIEEASGFTSNSLIYDLTSASYLSVESDEMLVYKYQAFYGRFNYTFSNKYILNLTGRRDGSSRFGPGKQFANFGAIGAAWLFYREKWIENNVSFLSFGKLRGSYGTTGNDQIGDYQFLDTYSSSGYEYQGVHGLQPLRLYNPNFGWETNKKIEAAFELGFLKDRVMLTTAWYQNRSSNQLVGLPLPGTTGFTTIQSNLDATVQNNGLEITLRTINIQKPNFNWTTSFNLSVAKNKLLSFPGLEGSPYKNDYVIGEPITIRKLFHSTGINPQTGIYQFADINGDGQISYADDRETVRNFSPKYFGGLHNQFTYKGWQLDFLFQFVKQLNFNFASTQGYAGTFRNQPAEIVNSWTQPGDNAQYQIYTTGVNQEAMQASEYYAESDAAVSDASYIRLKNISLSYDLPQEWLKIMHCKISLQAQNIFTITSYKGADPEFREAGFLPPLRIVSAGFQFTF
ncbi:SusC/RagA family TonB-linked outer membrane protein [Flavobacterium aquidurense]|uniref:SusC/RagA family TonB-linked outer membrane protein n=1 Tax=Flavobacterium aquidurense TaxID=362413 RepID=UPI003757F9ED